MLPILSATKRRKREEVATLSPELSAMANSKHLEILKRGHKAWFEWKDNHQHIRPDLSGADLSRAELDVATVSSIKARKRGGTK